jgi:NO-binding membrane sensor protein with MHYT domain
MRKLYNNQGSSIIIMQIIRQKMHFLPMLSTTSVVSRIPAVSRSLTGKPETTIPISTTSLVVPATSVTIALSVCNERKYTG